MQVLMKKQKIRAQEAVYTLLPNGINLVALTFYCVAEYVLGAGGEGQNLPTEFNLQESLHFWTVLDGTVTKVHFWCQETWEKKRPNSLFRSSNSRERAFVAA